MLAHSLLTLLVSTVIPYAATSPLPPVLPPSLPLGLPPLPVPNGLSALQKLPITLPLVKFVNSTSSQNVVKFDQARAKATRLRSHSSAGPQIGSGPGTSDVAGSRKAFNVDAVTQAISYVVTAYIGNPPTSYQLLVDTGSSNTWVGAGNPFIPSESTIITGNGVMVTYGSGFFEGYEVLDTITLADGLTIKNQSIGVAFDSDGFDGVDGILGVGPQDLTVGSLFPDEDQSIPTVTDNAWSYGYLDAYEIGISFRPTEDLDEKNGEMTFGGTDRSKYNGLLEYVPITSTSPADMFVGYDQSITYGDKEIVLNKTSGILDTGTTLILLATDAFDRYQNFTGGVPDDDTGLLRITNEQYENLQDLKFIIGGNEYALTPNAQIWPRALNEEIGGTADGIYLIVNDLQSPSGEGLDFINGMSFLERFYAVYDIGNSRVGLARTEYTDAKSN